jgi:uncharacterized protein (TIGR02452 family)
MASGHNKRREGLQKIAETTLEAIKDGAFELEGVSYDLKAKIKSSEEGTRYYSPDSCLNQWSPTSPATPSAPAVQSNDASIPTAQSNDTASLTSPTILSILEISTLEGARLLASERQSNIGVLNFASAKKVGGGFLSGAQAQEESIARSSTLYPSLKTNTAQQFYTLHNRDPKGGYYSHAMIYSPEVIVFRDDGGEYKEPVEIQVVTSPAVNAGVVRRSLNGLFGGKGVEVKIEEVMRERMARILFLFEKQGVRDVVLGSFGTGVFRNNVTMVATIWRDLLKIEGARFEHSFDNVVFAILGKNTYDEFKGAFEHQSPDTTPDS